MPFRLFAAKIREDSMQKDDKRQAKSRKVEITPWKRRRTHAKKTKFHRKKIHKKKKKKKKQMWRDTIRNFKFVVFREEFFFFSSFRPAWWVSTLRMALFRLFVWRFLVYSSFPMASFRLFAWRLFAAKKTKWQNSTLIDRFFTIYAFCLVQGTLINSADWDQKQQNAASDHAEPTLLA